MTRFSAIAAADSLARLYDMQMSRTQSDHVVGIDPLDLPVVAPLAAESTTGTVDDDDDRDDEHGDENEIPVRETDDDTEAPEEFEVDDEDELGHPEDDDADEPDEDDLDDDEDDLDDDDEDGEE